MTTYKYNNQQVVLLYDSEVQEINPEISPLSDEGCNINPYSLTDEVREWIEQGIIKVGNSYDDFYSGVSEDNSQEISFELVRNIENEQHLIEEWVTKAYASCDEATRELAVTTDRYYQWTSDRKKMLDNIHDCAQRCEGDKLRKELANLSEEWEDIVKEYNISDVYEDYSWQGLLAEAEI